MNIKRFLFILVLAFLKTSGQDSLTVVIAEQGDGIYSLLRKNNINPTKYYNSFIEINKESLKEEALVKGKSYYLPKIAVVAKDTISNKENFKTYPIFGDEFSKVDSLSNRLSGAVYYLVSGHGGPDPGAIENYNKTIIAEDEYAYDITLRLARELISHGASIFLIVQDENDGIRDDRILELDTDEVVLSNLVIPLNQLKRLKQRVEKVNELYKNNRGQYQRLLVTHVDSRSKGTNIDVFFYHHKKSKNGKRLAESIHQTFVKKYAKFQPNRGYHGTVAERTNLYMIKNTLPAVAYIEIGNIRNKQDQKRILDPDNRQALAKWIAEGVLLDFEGK